MVAPVIIAAGISAIGSLLSKPKSAKTNPSAITVDPAAGMNSNELDPVLQRLMSASNVQSQQKWNDTFGGLQESYQRRGLGGSGIEFANEAQQARQFGVDQQALNDSYAMELYKLWMARKQQERDWTKVVSDSYRTGQAAPDNGSGGFWNAVSNLAGGYLNGDRSTGGTTGGQTNSGYTGFDMPTSNITYNSSTFPTGTTASNIGISGPSSFSLKKQASKPQSSSLSAFWR